jgi:hypothetical protein
MIAVSFFFLAVADKDSVVVRENIERARRHVPQARFEVDSALKQASQSWHRQREWFWGVKHSVFQVKD